MIGNLLEFARDPLAFLEDLRSQHGNIARFEIGPLQYVMLAEPEAIEDVLVHEHESFEKHEFMRQSLGEALGDGLLVAEGETWQARRQLAQPNFRPSRIREYAPAFAEEVEQTVEAWASEPSRRLHEDMTDLTLRIAARTLFDVRVDDKTREIGQALDGMMQRFRAHNRVLVMLPDRLPLPANRRYHEGVEKLHGIVDALIEKRRRDPTGNDLMGRLIRAQREREAQLDAKQLREELVTFLTAGHETTAVSLTWTLWLLGTHEGVQDRLLAEIDQALGDQPPTPEDLDAMPLLEAVVNEAMRLLPPVWAFGRQAVEPVTVGDGVHLPEGTQVMLPQWLVHRDERWWEDPERFDPDRWLSGEKRPRFAHFPFGGGPRRCIGDAFAMLEAKLCLACLLQAFEIDAGEPRPKLEPSITLRPGGPVNARVQPR